MAPISLIVEKSWPCFVFAVTAQTVLPQMPRSIWSVLGLFNVHGGRTHHGNDGLGHTYNFDLGLVKS